MNYRIGNNICKSHMAKMKKTDHQGVLERMRSTWNSHRWRDWVGGGCVWCGTTSLENISAVSYKGKHTSTIGLSRCTAMYLFQRSESLKLHKDLYTNVHSFICNRPKLKTMLSIYQQVKRKSRLWYILTIGATQK